MISDLCAKKWFRIVLTVVDVVAGNVDAVNRGNYPKGSKAEVIAL